ncbi:MAG: hypothetical protein AABZ55_06705, partial [Bdellovibrionota bacterium]
AVNNDVTSLLQFTSSDQGQIFNVSGDINLVAEGLYHFNLYAKDLAGNKAQPDPLSVQFRVDRTPPKIILGVQDHYLTNSPNFSIPIAVDDLSPTSTVVMQNGSEIARFGTAIENVALTLREGINIFEISSTDAAGNMATPVQLIDIVLDTVPPVLANLTPTDTSIVSALNFAVSGSSNETLSSAKVNGQALTLSSDSKSFSGTYTAQVEGTLSLSWEINDLAGNTRTTTTSVDIVLRILNPNLLSAVPNSDGIHMFVRGAPGATRPGAQVTASAGFFNSGSILAGADGSFAISLFVFQDANVRATADGKTETAKVSVSISNTLLSGTVKDTTGTALSGVVISIANGAYTSVTDASGVFALAQDPKMPVTGDQMLVVDATGVSRIDGSGTLLKFSRTSIAITLALNTANVLQRPIFLAPIRGDSPISDSHAGPI